MCDNVHGFYSYHHPLTVTSSGLASNASIYRIYINPWHGRFSSKLLRISADQIELIRCVEVGDWITDSAIFVHAFPQKLRELKPGMQVHVGARMMVVYIFYLNKSILNH